MVCLEVLRIKHFLHIKGLFPFLSFSSMLSCYFSSVAFFPEVIPVLRCDNFSQVLEFLPELFEMLRNEGYMMTEAEAAIFLPCLVEKVRVQ